MVTSFLRPATVARIANATQRGHATKLALQGGGISLVLGRWNQAAEAYQPILPAQTVAIDYANQQEHRRGSDSATATYVDGWFEKLTPFEVEVGDRFTLTEADGQQMTGEIQVVLPPKLGVQRAGWTLLLGAQ